jgi:hypothetical protein
LVIVEDKALGDPSLQAELFFQADRLHLLFAP